jgi:predicted RNA polymerase sigma factor
MGDFAREFLQRQLSLLSANITLWRTGQRTLSAFIDSFEAVSAIVDSPDWNRLTHEIFSNLEQINAFVIVERATLDRTEVETQMKRLNEAISTFAELHGLTVS